MSYKDSQQPKKIARVRSLFAAALVLACAFGTVTRAAAQKVTPPPTPTDITPEAGNSAFLVGHAIGSQGYTCLPTSTGGTSWTVNPPRPEATLFADFFGQPVQIITHFASVNTSPKEGITPPLSGNATGRVRLIPARCGQWRWDISMPAPTLPAARIAARFNASY